MKIKQFTEGLREIETLASEFMDSVSLQITQDANEKHSAIVTTTPPYSSKTRQFKVVVSPYAPDELLIELDPVEETHFKADATGFYKYLWLAAESDLADAQRARRPIIRHYESSLST